MAAMVGLVACNGPSTAPASNAVVDTSSIGAGGSVAANTIVAQAADNSASMAANAAGPDDTPDLAPNEALAQNDQDTGAAETPYDASFDARFEQATHDACVRSAGSRGGDPDRVESYCACVVSRLRPLSTQEKMQLSQHPETLEAASRACASGD